MTRYSVIIMAAIVYLVAAGVTYATEKQELIERGQYLLWAGDCITCHTKAGRNSAPLAGGRALETPFGKVYSSNITPDISTGIGGWTDEQFVTALHEGVNPEGKHYFAAFPFTSYTRMSRDDALAIKAYLFTLKPVHQPNRSHELVWYINLSGQLGAFAWKFMFFEPERFQPDRKRSDVWNRGAYLVQALGHCSECHTPRNVLGGLKKDRYLAGSFFNPEGENPIPGITNDPENGIGKWPLGDIELFLELGMLPNGDFTGSGMGSIIDQNTSKLTPEDRHAIAVYLQSVGGPSIEIK